MLASALCFFFTLTAVMVLRPGREALGMQRGIKAIRWLFIGTAVVTLPVNPVFGLLVSRFGAWSSSTTPTSSSPPACWSSTPCW